MTEKKPIPTIALKPPYRSPLPQRAQAAGTCTSCGAVLHQMTEGCRCSE